MFPAIVIPAYNRPHTLARLLASVAAADYPFGSRIPLVISIDQENGKINKSVQDIAESFHWTYGSKEIVMHREHIGLLGNFYFCGGLTDSFGSIVFLEDDSLVSPSFYHFAHQSLRFVNNAPGIAGVSLHRYGFNGYTHHPFEPLTDASDIFFMQVSSIMGQAWTSSQWQAFDQWRKTNSKVQNEALHEVWTRFSADDHFPILTSYLVSTEQFYLFPRVSLAAGFGDAGTHFRSPSYYYQVPLQLEKTVFQFQRLEVSNCVYDSFMEILPSRLKRLAPALDDLDLAIDLNATKGTPHLRTSHVITTRSCRNSIKTFALAMHPPEANLIFNAEGDGVNLCLASDLRWDAWHDLKTGKRLHDYHSRGNRSLKRSLVYSLLDRVNRYTR